VSHWHLARAWFIDGWTSEASAGSLPHSLCMTEQLHMAVAPLQQQEEEPKRELARPWIDLAASLLCSVHQQ
jgi:hypothetical protein